MNPKIIVFASGTKDNGGSGFENLVKSTRNKRGTNPGTTALRAGYGAGAEKLFDYEIVAVVSNHENGGVRKRADRLGIPFVYFNPSQQHTDKLEFISMSYRDVVQKNGAEWVALSGWFKHVKGLDPQRTFNIHPALLSQLGGRFGGKGMYGTRLYEAVKTAFDVGEISESGFTMHFVTDELDRGPAFFEYRIPLQKGMTADDIEKAVRVAEHEWQPKITNMVVHEEIRWDGKNPETLIVPVGYEYLPKAVADYQ